MRVCVSVGVLEVQKKKNRFNTNRIKMLDRKQADKQARKMIISVRGVKVLLLSAYQDKGFNKWWK